jgi:thiamine biosynthesis protein ThiS
MNILLNGQPHALPGSLTVAQLMESLAVSPAQVAIERNREIVPRSRYGEVMLAEGDAVEIVSFIGGG